MKATFASCTKPLGASPDRFRLTFKAPGASKTNVLLKEFNDSHFFVVAAPSAFSLLRKALRRAPRRSKMQPQMLSRVPQELPEASLHRTWNAQRRLPSHSFAGCTKPLGASLDRFRLTFEAPGASKTKVLRNSLILTFSCSCSKRQRSGPLPHRISRFQPAFGDPWRSKMLIEVAHRVKLVGSTSLSDLLSL